MRAEIQNEIDSGKSEDAILAGMIEKYGPTVLSSPPPRGFFLSAWVFPFIGILAGAGIIFFYLKKKPGSSSEPVTSIPDAHNDASITELLEQIREVDR